MNNRLKYKYCYTFTFTKFENWKEQENKLYELLNMFCPDNACYSISDFIEEDGKEVSKVLLIGFYLTSIRIIMTELNGYRLRKLDTETVLECCDCFWIDTKKDGLIMICV